MEIHADGGVLKAVGPRHQLGASFETFTNVDFLEQETLGPMTKLAPGASLEHIERWTLHKNVHIREWNDAELDRVLLPLVGK